MNYIQTLQRELREANERADATQALIGEFRAHLASTKFHSDFLCGAILTFGCLTFVVGMGVILSSLWSQLQ